MLSGIAIIIIILAVGSGFTDCCTKVNHYSNKAVTLIGYCTTVAWKYFIGKKFSWVMLSAKFITRTIKTTKLHEAFRMSGILKYFKRKNELPDPKGPLSAVINPSAIAAANKEAKRSEWKWSQH